MDKKGLAIGVSDFKTIIEKIVTILIKHLG